MSATTWERIEDLRWEAFHWRKESSLLVKLALALMGAAAIGLAAQIKLYLPWTPIPITGQTMAVLLTGVLLGAEGGAWSTVFYLLLGAAGMPWFASARGGLLALAGPTTGYLLGFILAATSTGYLCDHLDWARRLPGMLLIMLVANFVLVYIPGLLWLGYFTGTWSLQGLLAIGLFPFVAGDLTKIMATSALAGVMTPKRNY